MTLRLFVLDVPENGAVAEVAQNEPGVQVSRIGPYYVIESSGRFSIDRRATGCRHAVWYSCVAGLSGCRIAQFDKDALALEPR